MDSPSFLSTFKSRTRPCPEPLFGASRSVSTRGTSLGLCQRGFVGGLASRLRSFRISVSLMSGKCCFIPRVATAGAIRDVLNAVQERSWKTSIGTALQVVHVVNALTGVAMYEEP